MECTSKARPEGLLGDLRVRVLIHPDLLKPDPTGVELEQLSQRERSISLLEKGWQDRTLYRKWATQWSGPRVGDGVFNNVHRKVKLGPQGNQHLKIHQRSSKNITGQSYWCKPPSIHLSMELLQSPETGLGTQRQGCSLGPEQSREMPRGSVTQGLAKRH